MRIPVLCQEGYEADDVHRHRGHGRRPAQASTSSSAPRDKDCRQLIGDHVRLYNLRKKESMDRAGLLEEWEVAPEQVVDLQALVGDSVDNVPGVPGIGPKTAAKLLQEFGTLDHILANIDRVPGAKKQESLRASTEQVKLSRDLVRLARDVPLEMDWEGWQLREPDSARLLALFQEWGFHRFADQVRSSSFFRGPTPVARSLFPEPSDEEMPVPALTRLTLMFG